MKVLHAAETLKGGTATMVRQLVTAQAAAGDVVDVVAPAGQSGELGGVEGVRIRTYPRRRRSAIDLARLAIRFVSTVVKVKPDVVHLHSSFAGAVCRPLLVLLRPILRPKVVYSPHCWAFIAAQGRRGRALAGLVETVLSRWTDVAICESNFERDAAEPYRLRSRLELIPDGVEAPLLPPAGPSLRSDGRQQLLFVGRFDEQKGFDLLSAAAERMDADVYHFQAVGGFVRESDGDLSSSRMIESIDWQDREGLARIYNSSTAVVMPSRWESFGLVALEAMSYGIPVIASDCCSLPEIVDHGVNGWLFKTGDVDDLVATLEGLTIQDYRRASKACLATYSSKYSADRMHAEYAELYASVLGIARSRRVPDELRLAS